MKYSSTNTAISPYKDSNSNTHRAGTFIGLTLPSANGSQFMQWTMVDSLLALRRMNPHFCFYGKKQTSKICCKPNTAANLKLDANPDTRLQYSLNLPSTLTVKKFCWYYVTYFFICTAQLAYCFDLLHTSVNNLTIKLQN